jgi:hypothetical protein
VDGFNDSGQDAKYRQDKGKQAHESTSDAWRHRQGEADGAKDYGDYRQDKTPEGISVKTFRSPPPGPKSMEY